MSDPARYIFDFVSLRTDSRKGDGDTYWCTVLVRPAISAFRITFGPDIAELEFRLDNWDCPETKSSAAHTITAWEKQCGLSARTAAADWFNLHLAQGISVKSEKDPEKYGRWLGTFTAGDGSDLGEWLAGFSLAVPYHGKAGEKRWRDVYDLPGRAS